VDFFYFHRRVFNSPKIFTAIDYPNGGVSPKVHSFCIELFKVNL
jgi:hypothetical protein